MSPKAPQKDMEPMVFISHSERDGDIATELGRRLRSHGLKVFLDYSDLVPGADFQRALLSAIEDADFMVVLMSPNYFKSKWSRTELSYGLEANKRLLPVLISGRPEGPLSYLQYIDASKESPLSLADEVARLVRASRDR
jgi:hypothetical protein